METDIHTGTDFVGYRLEQLIGEGGMGVVYRAYDRRMKRTVALKFVAPRLALDGRFRERFLREIELAAAFEHPNAVPIHDAGDVDGRLYLAMRFVEGSDLSTLLRSEAPLDPRRAIRICGQVARALDAAHRIGLVHRDVKPSNVLLDAGEHVYLADFGLTRRLVDEGSPPLDGRSLGTPAYVAPEQLEGEPVDGRTDLYSLACLLFECLTGEPPFRRDSRLAVAWAHLEEEPPSASARNAALPAAVDDALAMGLAKDPADRQQTCAALIAAAETALGLQAPRRSRRRMVVLAAGAVVLAAVAAALATILSASDGGAADPPLYGAPGSVVRIDPENNAVIAVVPVGLDPQAVAVHGSRVWVFNQVDGAVASVDERTNQVVQTTRVHARPLDVSAHAGPVLAADAGGAWLIGSNDAGRPVLVRITGSGRRPTVYPLDREPRGVAVGYGAVWVVAQGERDSQLLRIDPATGRITHRTRVAGRRALDSVAVGLGYVWTVGSSSGTLYRFDARTGRRRGQLLVGTNRAPRPYLMRGFVWVGLTVFRPRTLDTVTRLACCSADAGEAAGGFGSAWSTDSPTGAVVRWGSDWEVAATVRVVALAPDFAHRIGQPPGAGCLTSIAAGADNIWVTVASSETYSCGSRGAGAERRPFWLGFEGSHGSGPFAGGIQHEGHFTASAPLCAAGDAVDIEQDGNATVRRHTCSDGSGSFTARIAPVGFEHGEPGQNRGGWQIVAGSGDYARLRGKGTFTAIHLGGDLGDNATITYRTTWSGVVDFDVTAPDLAISRASVHRVKRGIYRLDVALAARAKGGAVSYEVVVTTSPPEILLATRAGTTASGTASMSIPMGAPDKRVVRVSVVASDRLGNERTVARTVHVPS